MISKDYLWVGENFNEIFRSASLSNSKKIYNDDFGRLIRQEPEKSIRYFQVDHKGSVFGYYIKIERPSFISHLKYLLKKRRLCKLNTRHELELIQVYQEKGIPVVEPVALGEHRVLGIPTRGFLVQREVVGREFIDLMKEGSPAERIKLLKAYGKLVADIHSKGLLTSIVRVTDLICASEIDIPWKDIKLVVIDREKGSLETERFSSDQASGILASILIRFFIYIDAPTAKEVRCFLKTYLKCLRVNDEISFKAMFLDTKCQFKILFEKYKTHVDPISKRSICE